MREHEEQDGVQVVTMMHKLIIPAMLLGALGATPAFADILINFDGLGDQVSVGNFYAAQGVNFSDFFTAEGFGATTQPNLGYVGQGNGIVDTDFGFTSLSFAAGFFSEGTVSIYSGTGGTGSLLATRTGTLGDPFNFTPNTISFIGIGRSFTAIGGVGQLGFDDINFETAVPEPATWALMIGGFAMTGFAMRRKAALTA